MNTQELKRFAQEARRKLLEQVCSKLSFVLTTDSPELREKTQQIKQLREELNKTTKEQLIEKVAYTWFNRIMALRFMDANGYQPLGIRITTPKDGYTSPELLDEAKRGNIPEELAVKRQKVYDLLDGKIPSTNPQNEAYKELLIAACNHLNAIFPFLFEKINDFTELLLPDDLTSDFSIVTDIRDGMPVDDCRNVEIIGWLYQFYISEEKDRLINAKKRYKAHEIAPVTQLFTPKWIVQYMVDNTLGQLWKEARPKTSIIKDLEFYIKPENEDIIPNRQLKSPEEISFFDPCVGSAHILSYAFDIFYKIYQEEGYSESIISENIITKNLFGIDIDERAAQLAGFAIMMKGREHDRRFLRKSIIPNIIPFKNIASHDKFSNAETIGSLIRIRQEDVGKIRIEENSIFSEQERHLKKQATFISKRYDIVVTNPPYLNAGNMEGVLKQFVEREYNTTKSDLFACFLLRVSEFIKHDGIVGFICPYVWMFIQTYEKLRERIIEDNTICSLIQLEYNAFEPAVVPICTFTLRHKLLKELNGTYIKLSQFKGFENQAPRALEAIKNPNCGWIYKANQHNFRKVQGTPIAYWFSDKFLEIFDNAETIKELCDAKVGLQTGDNIRFRRNWFEVPFDKISLNIRSKTKWFLFCSGGEFRKWAGNLEMVINWEDDGYEVKNFVDADGNLLSRPQSKEYYFQAGLTWSRISSSYVGVRIKPDYCVFSDAGPSLFPKTNAVNLSYLLGFMNSKVAFEILNLLNPTMTFQVGDIIKLPFRFDGQDNLIKDVDSVCSISITEWNSRETSAHFAQNELLRINNNDEIEFEETYLLFKQYWQVRYFKMHELEEKINSQFITTFKIQGELIPNVPLEEVTILQDELNRDEVKKLNKFLIRGEQNSMVQNYHDIKLPFISKEIMAQFISYSVGCIFGRFSLDKEGRILANQGETLNDYFNKIGKNYNECSFIPDKDNILPILDDEWFEDDIIGRFKNFLKITFGERNYSKNLSFIEEQIGKDIRKYFLKDFYPDHIKRYKKRPIYWMFSSPKGSFNVLIYMHRYTPDTVSNILNKYLKEFIGKLKTRREHLQQVQVSGSPAEKTKAIKETDSIDKMLVELQEYERDVLYPLATERISIDLDDGVLVNYNKFGKAVKEVSGLNDPTTKKKVMQFDWIDTTQIR